MRRALRFVATLALGTLLLAPPQAMAQRRSIVLSAYTLNQDLFHKHIYLPFRQRCQCEILLETGNAADRLAKLEARRAHPIVVLIQLTDFAALEASTKGLLETLDYSKIPNAQQIHDFARDPTQTTQVATLFAEDKAWLAPVGRFAWMNLQGTGKPLKWIVPKEGQAGALNVFAIPKGSAQTDLALQLIDFWLSKEVFNPTL